MYADFFSLLPDKEGEIRLKILHKMMEKISKCMLKYVLLQHQSNNSREANVNPHENSSLLNSTKIHTFENIHFVLGTPANVFDRKS